MCLGHFYCKRQGFLALVSREKWDQAATATWGADSRTDTLAILIRGENFKPLVHTGSDPFDPARSRHSFYLGLTGETGLFPDEHQFCLSAR